MGDQGQWFKLWVGADDDPDLGNLSLEDFGRWCRLGIYLKKHGTNGTVSIKTPALPLQQRFRVTTYEAVKNVLTNFPNCNVEEMHNSTVSPETTLTVTWRNWSKYQGDYSTFRVRKLREMKRSKRRREEKRREERRNNKSSNEDSSSRPEMTPQEFVESWNEICASEGLPAVQDLTNGRRAKIRSRLKKYPVLQFWEKVFHGIIHSPYLMGKKRKEGDTWKPDIDWLIRNDENPLKVVEGKYG